MHGGVIMEKWKKLLQKTNDTILSKEWQSAQKWQSAQEWQSAQKWQSAK